MSFNLKSLFPYLAGAGASGLSSQFSALAPFSAAIGAGAGALTNQKNPLAGAAQGFAGGGAGSTLAGGVKGLLSGGGGGALDKFGSGAMSGLQSFGNSIPGFGGVGTSNPTGAFAKFFSGGNGSMPMGGSGISNADAGRFSFTQDMSGDPLRGYSATSGQIQPPTFASSYNPSTPSSNVFNTASGTGGSTPTGSINPMNMFKSLIPGAAVAGIGSLLAPQVQAPDYSGVKADLTSKIQGSQNPAAVAQYMSTLNAPNGASAEAGVANAKLINDRQRADAIRGLQQQFSANNGSLTGNSAYNDALAKTNAQYDQNYSAQAAQTQFQYDQQQQQQKMAAANALQGMDDTQLQYYAGLANLDVMQIQEKTGMDVASAQAIKNIASTAGQLLMEKSLGVGGAR